MAFPTSPSDGDFYNENGVTWLYVSPPGVWTKAGGTPITIDESDPVFTASAAAGYTEAPIDGTPYSRQDGGWVAAGSGGATAINDLTDVDTTTLPPTGGDVLKWTGSVWAPTVDDDVDNLVDLTDTTITSPANGEVLQYNGSAWVNATAPAGYTDADVQDYLNTLTYPRPRSAISARVGAQSGVTDEISDETRVFSTWAVVSDSGAPYDDLSIRADYGNGLVFQNNHDPLIDLTDFTIEFWAETVATATPANGWKVSYRDSGTSEVVMFDSNVKFQNLGGTGNVDTGLNLITFPSSGWHHYAVVREGTEVRWYIDGVKVNTITLGSAPAFTVGKAVLKAYGDFGTTSPGHYDDINLYDQAVYDADFIPPATYGLNRVAGVTVLDDLADVTTTSPANGEVLTYNGSSWVNSAPAGGGGLSWEATTVFGGDTVNYAPATTWLGIQDVDNGYVLGSKTDNASFNASIRLFGGTQKTYPYHGGMVHYASTQTVVYGRSAVGLAKDGGLSVGLNSSGEFAYHGDALTTPKFKVNTQGEVTFNNAFTFPNSDGTADQVLTTDGSGNVTWATSSSTTTSADPLNLTASIGAVSGRVNTFEFDGSLTDDESAETWTFTGTASYANDRNAVASSALTLGSGEYLSKSTPLVGPNDTTWFVGFWFKSNGTAFPSNGSLFGTLYTTNLLHIGTTLTNSTTPSLSLTDYTSGWTRAVASTQPTWTDWNHYALQRNGNVLQLFLNGALVATGSAAGDTYPDAWYLGYYTGTMQGDYDQLYIHDEAIITDTSSPFNTDNPGGGDVKVGEIDVTGDTSNSTMVFKQYASSVLGTRLSIAGSNIIMPSLPTRTRPLPELCGTTQAL